VELKEYYAGVDIGSTMTKVVIMNRGIASAIIGPTGAEQRRLADQVMKKALKEAGVSFDSLIYIVATGYGRINVPFADRQITEISCHAKGVSYFFPESEMCIDIGGQDSKGIRIRDGKPVDFVMNDKCAAGTGRFLEITADALGIKVGEMGEIALASKSSVQISNLCTIFAEQEVVERLADGVALNDLVAGILESLAGRVSNMVKRLSVPKEIVVTGGVAKNAAIVDMLSRRLGCKAGVPPEPLITGAVGAAMIGKEIVEKAKKTGVKPEKKRRRLDKVKIF